MAVEKVRPIDRYLEIFYALGAVPVLLGALFKITNTAPIGSANTWLQVGLWTEALVFLSFGLLYIFAPPKKVDELGNPVETTDAANQKAVSQPVTTLAMEDMLRAADITPEALDRLGNGFKNLEVSINKLSSASESLVETEEYARQVKETTLAMHRMNTYYNKLAETSHALLDSAEDAKNTQKEMADLSKNLSKLNAMYSGMISAMQIKGS